MDSKNAQRIILGKLFTLFEDLEKDGAKNNRSPCIELELKFPPQYPHSPFVRVVRPRFQFHTGHVTVGGSICQQDLTSQGWSSTTTVEGLLHSLQQLMIEGKVVLISIIPYRIVLKKRKQRSIVSREITGGCETVNSEKFRVVLITAQVTDTHVRETYEQAQPAS